MEHTRLSTVLWTKLVYAVHDHTMREIADVLLVGFAIGAVGGAVIDLDATHSVLAMHHYAPPKAAAMLALILHRKDLRIRRPRWKWRTKVRIQHVETIEGIPQEKVIDFLEKHGHFKREVAKVELGIPHHRCQVFAENMERVSILVRDPKQGNARVLNPEFTRADIESIFKGKRTAEKLEPLWRRTERGFTSAPSGSEPSIPSPIPLSPAPGFVTRILAQ